MNDRARKRRERIVLGLLLVAGLAVTTRLVELQVREHDAWLARARSLAEERVEIPGPRGTIVDRRGRVLAVSVPDRVLDVEPVKISPRGLAALERAAGCRTGHLVRHARAAWRLATRHCDGRCVERVERLVERGLVPRDAIHWARGFARRYPHGSLAAHVLGFVTLDGRSAEGVEQRYGDFLRSRGTTLRRLRVCRHQPILEEREGTTRPPSALMLTLDTRIQETLEEALDDAIREHGARGARGVVLDPWTGDVLALASRPAFDPNRFWKSPAEAHRNAVIERPYEPGSVMKPMTAAVLLAAGVVREKDTVDCEGGRWRVGRRFLHDHHPWARLTLRQVIEVSSNIGIAKFARRVDPGVLWRGLRRLGFGQRTGIDLPAESPGSLVPPSAWRGTDRDVVAFGHRMTATTLQVARAYATIANGGFLVTPRVARALGDPDGGWHPRALAPPRRVLAPGVARRLARWLTGPIEGEHGTAPRAALAGWRVAGKTGTAEKLVAGRYDRGKNIVTFAGFAPLEHPRVVVVVTIDEPTRGGRTAGAVAAPVFARVTREALRLLRVPADPERLLVTGSPSRGGQG